MLAVAAACAAPQQPRKFSNPQEAGQALADAAAKNDTAALLNLFGAPGADIVQSGDAEDDRRARAEFAHRAGEKLETRVEPMNPGRATVITGADEWPFPVPLIRTKSGEWFFDSTRGRTEILARRIGRNELTVIDVCRAYVEAQVDYASHDRDGGRILEYASRVASSAGKNDGLYVDGDANNLVPKDFVDAVVSSTRPAKAPYHGYYFRVLEAQGPDAPGGAHNYLVDGRQIGGFALIAYPAEYGVSGIQTFLVNQDGVVYEKDLGPVTTAVARQTARFNPDRTWRAIQEE